MPSPNLPLLVLVPASIIRKVKQKRKLKQVLHDKVVLEFNNNVSLSPEAFEDPANNEQQITHIPNYLLQL